MSFEKRKPHAVFAIMILNFLVYMLQIHYEQISTNLSMFHGAIQTGEWYRIITSSFIHYGVYHLLCNMISMAMIGTVLENAIGAKKTLIVYLYGIIGSGLLINFVGGENHLHGGASGAIWALLTATIIYKAERKEYYMDILKCLLFNIIITLFVQGISWQGHIGGGIAGALIMHGMIKCKEVYWWGGTIKSNVHG